MAKNKAFDWDYFDFNKNKPQEFLNNPAKYIENNFRNLFGKEYNKENLINLVSEEWDDYTTPKEFKTAKSMMKESGDLDIFYRDLEQRGITEEIALTEGHHNIRKRFIGKSYEDSIKRDLAEQNYKVHRGSRTIDVSLQDSMMNLKFDNPEDFNILNNAIEFNNSTYKGWKSYNYNKENKQLIKDAPTFFDHYANNLKKEGNYTEHYVSHYLNYIQKKAEEFGYNIDLQGIINERKVQAQAERSFIHEGHAMDREYRVKQDRINQIEEEMKKFKRDSPEYKALELERNNIEVSLRDWKGTHQTLELPPPREGAPMFEGGAVPSVIANNPEYGVNYNINTNASSTADDIMLGRLDRLMSQKNVEKKMWTNRDFVFGDDFINNQEFQNKVLDFYSQDGRKEDLFNKLARLDNYSADKFYYQTYSNAFEAYKELEGLDNAGMQKKVIERLKSLGYTEKDFRHHFETLREGADFINWQGSRKFIDYDSNLYKNANNINTSSSDVSYDPPEPDSDLIRRRGNKKRTTSNAFEDDLDVAIESRNTPWRYTRGENFWDKKHNRHYVYDGIYNGYGGRYVLYDREGNAAVVDEETMNSFSKYKGKNPLDLDRQVDYNIALDDYEHFRKQDKIKYKNPDAYYTQLKNIMDKIDNYETEIGKSYKNFRGNKNYHKSREYVSDEVKAHFDKKNANQQQQAQQQAQQQEQQQQQQAQEQEQQQAEQQQQADPDVEPKFATEEDLNPENDPLKKTKGKNVAGGVDESVKIFVDPSSFKTLDQFADLTDNEIQRYIKTLNNVDRQDVYNDLIAKRQQARINRVRNHAGGAQGYIDDILDSQMPFETPNKHHPIYGYTSATEDYKNPKGFSRPELDIKVDEKTGEVILNKTGATHHVGEARPKVQPRLQEGDDIFGWLKKHKLGLGDAINVLFSIGSYNEARREGHGVVSSAARAAGQFVMGELTGFWGGLALQAAKAVPKMAIKGTELLYKENRKMNSAANSQVFGGVQFQDTQQLATMRQSGMEMAKMAQYNLQQTLMGNEASYLHR